jgi:cullin 3
MDDTYQVNFKFSNNQIKVKIPVMHSKSAKQNEDADLKSKVEDDRKHMIEATIVKVMKSRRRLSHNDLITEATKILQSKFNPDP